MFFTAKVLCYTVSKSFLLCIYSLDLLFLHKLSTDFGILRCKKYMNKWHKTTKLQNTHSMYLQDPRQVAGAHNIITTHTACTYKTQDRSPVHMTKLQHTQHVPTRPETGRRYTWQNYNTHSMYLQDPRQVAGTHDKITTHTQHVPTRPETGRRYTWQNYNTHSMYLQDPRQVAGTHDKITTHTACTYKTRDRSPVHMTKLQHTQHVPTRPETGRRYTWQNYNTHSMYLQDPRQVAGTHDKITTHTACTYKTWDRSPVHDKITTHTACTYKTRDRSPVHMT